MGIRFDNNVVAFLLIVTVLFVLAILMKARRNKIVLLFVQIVVGAITIFVINLIGAKFNITLPLNLFSIIIAGLFQFPGITFLFIIKYIIYS